MFPTPYLCQKISTTKSYISASHSKFFRVLLMPYSLDCFFLWDWSGGALAQMSSMSLILHCESTAKDTTAKEASLHFTVGSSTDHGHSRRPWSAWTVDLNMVCLVNTQHRHKHGPCLQHRTRNTITALFLKTLY